VDLSSQHIDTLAESIDDGCRFTLLDEPKLHRLLSSTWMQCAPNLLDITTSLNAYIFIYFIISFNLITYNGKDGWITY
jgi:hypothetical protein